MIKGMMQASEKIAFMDTNLRSFLYPLPPELKEKVSQRLCKTECSLLFNGVCVNASLLPYYSNI